MGKIWVEVCLISARGLRKTSSFWKFQWFAVGWIDPNNKYCTKIDASGNANPSWKTKFAVLLDDSRLQDAALQVEVYSREPIFLREKLHGTATIVLKEFLAKYNKSIGASRPATEEFGSYQLRTRNSSRNQGFVDISIRISEEREELLSYPGEDEGVVLMDRNNNMASSTEGRPGQGQNYPLELSFPVQKDQSSDAPILPYPASHSYSSIAGPMYPSVSGPSYHTPRTPPPPPPPPSHVGYVPTFLPTTDYINMPSSYGRGQRPALTMGVGAGALAAGAVIFGDDFMSGFNIPSSLQEPSLTISTNPPF